MLSDVPQLLVNGLMAGSILAIPAIGLSAIFAVLRFPNFALASHASVGAFAGWVANAAWGVPLVPALFFAFAAAGAVGIATDEFVLRRLRGAGFITTAIGSIALTVLLENMLRLFFGNTQRGFDLPMMRDWRLGDLRLGPQQVQNLLVAAVIMAAIFLFLRFTRTGKTMRAVADNPALADIKGIDAARVGRIVSFLGMGLAGVGGMLIGLDTAVDPLLGYRVMLSIFAAAVVGGLGSIPGAVVGALVVGVGEELSLLAVSPNYRGAVGFAAVLLVLAVRPRGILGQRAY